MAFLTLRRRANQKQQDALNIVDVLTEGQMWSLISKAQPAYNNAMQFIRDAYLRPGKQGSSHLDDTPENSLKPDAIKGCLTAGSRQTFRHTATWKNLTLFFQ